MDAKDTKDTKTPHGTTTTLPPSAASASTPDTAPPSYHAHPTTKPRTPSIRPGEDLMQSGDPATADLRAWAQDKERHVPGTDGSFITGPMSMGVGAVSGGPLFLPRKEYIVDPPMHEVDRMEKEKEKLREEEGGGKKERRGSVREFLGRLGGRKEGEKKEGEGGGEHHHH